MAAAEIVLGDNKYENETFFYDLAYLNSDFSQNGKIFNFFFSLKQSNLIFF